MVLFRQMAYVAPSPRQEWRSGWLERWRNQSVCLQSNHIHSGSLMLYLVSMVWVTVAMMVELYPDNILLVCQKLFWALVTLTMSCQQWESLLDLFNYMAEVVPLGHLCHCRLCLEGNHLFTPSHQDLQLLVPKSLTLFSICSCIPNF